MLAELLLTGTLVMSQPGLSDQREIVELIQTLRQGEKDVDAYTTAVKRLVALDQKAVPSLIEALTSTDEELRAQAAGALGQIGNASAVPSLAKLVKQGGRSGVEALRALCHIGGAEAAIVLMSALPQENSAIQTRIARALGPIGDSRAIEPLGKLLGTVDRDSYSLRIAAAEALGHFRDPRARALLRKAIEKDPTWRVYRAATLALNEINEDPLPVYLRQKADFAVVKIEEPPEGAEAYVRRWREERKKEMQAAKQAGVPDEPPPSWPTVGMFACKVEIDRAGHFLLEYARQPSSFGDPAKEVVELLMEYLVGNRKVGGRRRAQELIVRIGQPAVPSLLNGLKRGLKYQCAECLAEIGDPRATEPLRDYVATQSPARRKRLQVLLDKLEAKQKGKGDTDK